MLPLEDESVHCVVTSPPYWGLRDYGLAAGTFEAASRMCSCGAWLGTLGLEPTPDLYVEHIVEVFREVRRVLRKDGVVWLNIGDSYAAGGNGSRDPERWPKQSRNANGFRSTHSKKSGGLKPKDLAMVPFRVALALQADGWWIRSDIIWAKGRDGDIQDVGPGSPMPESASDRPTAAHEHVLLLARSERYFYDAEAIREPQVSGHPSGNGFKRPARLTYRDGKGPRGNDQEWQPSGAGRNRRNVWLINPQPTKDDHYATFPERLVEPCVLAGTSESGACAECGAPLKREVEVSGGAIGEAWNDHENDLFQGQRSNNQAKGSDGYQRKTVGWHRTCDHEAETVPATVLDPFVGSGTTAVVAQKLGRRAVGVDASDEYLKLAAKRLEAVPLPMVPA